jgi:putative endopeptidase
LKQELDMKNLYLAFARLACVATLAAASLGQNGARPAFGTWGVDLSGMDTSVHPGNDFFRYVNGTWYDGAVIPADRTRTGGFDDLSILSEKRLGDIVAALEAKPYNQLTGEEKRLRDLYDAFMDTNVIEKNGLAPAAKTLADLASIQTLDGVARAMGDRSHGAGLFSSGPQANPKDSNSYVMTVAQSGLGMPNRDYYLRDDKALAATRESYRTYLTTMLEMTGAANAAARGAAVFALETEIAKLHWPAADRRDADKTYNPMTIAQLQAYAPGFPWASLFSAEGFSTTAPKGARTVVVRENTAFPGLAKLFAATPVAVWRDWLTLQYLHRISAYLPKRFDDADFAFFGKVLDGQEQQLDRAKRAVQLLDAQLGPPLGKIYVAKYFPPESKVKVEQLIANLLNTF